MILLDTNLLIYANDQAAPEYTIARPWFEHQLNGPARVGVPWPSLLGFMRLATNPAVLRVPITMATAWGYVRDWLDRPNVWIPLPGDRHAETLSALLRLPVMTSRLVPDAHLAALAIEHGLTLCSTDGDFAKFPGLRWQNPLAADNQKS